MIDRHPMPNTADDCRIQNPQGQRDRLGLFSAVGDGRPVGMAHLAAAWFDLTSEERA